MSVWIDNIIIVEQVPAFNPDERPLYYDIECVANYYGSYVVQQYVDDVFASETRILIGYWKFNENSGDTTVDGSGRGGTGSLKNGPLWVEGKIGNALKFDGIDDCVEIRNSYILYILGTQITLETWFKPVIELNSTTPHFNLADRERSYGFQMNQDAFNPTPDGKMWFFYHDCPFALGRNPNHNRPLGRPHIVSPSWNI